MVIPIWLVLVVGLVFVLTNDKLPLRNFVLSFAGEQITGFFEVLSAWLVGLYFVYLLLVQLNVIH